MKTLATELYDLMRLTLDAIDDLRPDKSEYVFCIRAIIEEFERRKREIKEKYERQNDR